MSYSQTFFFERDIANDVVFVCLWVGKRGGCGGNKMQVDVCR